MIAQLDPHQSPAVCGERIAMLALIEENILQTLTNLGGLGALAAVLLYLHLNGLSRMSKELNSERERCDKQLEQHRTDWKEALAGLHGRFDELESNVCKTTKRN